MLRFIAMASLLIGLLSSTSSMAVTPVHKCELKGSVTYQRDPCASGERAPQPTLEQLNGERKKDAASAASAAVKPVTALREPAPPATSATGTDGKTKPAPAPMLPAQSTVISGFRSDGRKYCSQMTSCAEARYFLANCPGVRMDGDGNGVPCERQWCKP